MNVKRKKICIFLFIVISTAVYSQVNENTSIQVYPTFNLGIGNSQIVDLGATMGGGANLKIQHLFDSIPFLFIEGDINIAAIPYPGNNLTLLAGGIGTGVNLKLANRMSIDVGVHSGWYLGLVTGKQNVFSNPYFGGNANFHFDITPNITLSAGAGYNYYVYPGEALYHGLSFSIGTVFRLGSSKNRSELKVESIDIDPVFPILYEYYSDNPFGNLNLKNTERNTISDLTVSFYVDQYMEQPVECAVIPQLKSGETAEIDLKAFFTTGVLNLTDTSKVSTEIQVSYNLLGKQIAYSTPQTVKIMGRNSMTWDDDRKAASFVSPKDPTVQLFARNTAGVIRELDQNAINLNLRIAMGMFETLELYGMNYVIDPASSYIELSENADAVDFLQFPSQTLTFRAGDCDDLSILATSLLESVGIETAFITIPGHIYMAFSLGISKEESRRTFTNLDEFIFYNDTTWIPVEITLISDGFLEAWKYGAREWREYESLGRAAIFPIHEAWQEYKAATVPGGALPLLFPSQDKMISNYNESLDIFIERELAPRVVEFRQKLQKNDSARLRNSFGVLYAKYGMYDEAEEQFNIAARKKPDFAAPLINLGNILFLRERLENALEMYTKAEKLKPESPTIIAAIAKTRYEMEEYDAVKNLYQDLQLMDPDLAAQYAYLNNEISAIGRASAAKSQVVTDWEDEEEPEEE
jgi:tetratricopeptide (TPR) repeat protein